MRDARYMRLISWTLQSGSEQFIYDWNQTNADPGPRNWQKGTDKAATETNGWEYKLCQKLNANRQDKKNLDNGIKRMGIQVLSRVTCKLSRQGKS
jgi:hypothetical protein